MFGHKCDYCYPEITLQERVARDDMGFQMQVFNGYGYVRDYLQEELEPVTHFILH